MLMIMLTVIIGMKMHEYDNDGDDGDDFFFSELLGARKVDACMH